MNTAKLPLHLDLDCDLGVPLDLEEAGKVFLQYTSIKSCKKQNKHKENPKLP